ncbi:S8 family serine peptidase [Streptomyces sp. NBC_01775]|uniref:S8 family serine peptidase n=1 Tax=Streptomyces sp. NBC_01775 TaxID=2975939 RepID=UPI002DD97AD8|nr:S8 family serine peptidase [Streptomyces sp. NBC_01775]WSB76402.1 S8 family serine peptidase [Streptomyces sp. NBC_01775]
MAALQGGLAPTAVAEDVQSQQWYLDGMQIKKIWKVSTGKGVKVAVVDGGVDSSTQSLRGQVLPGKDISGAPGDENKDDVGHGTTMAELIAGTGRGGTVKGVAPDAKILPIRTTLRGIKGIDKNLNRHAEAIRAAADSDAKIINMSWGTSTDGPTKRALDYAVSKGKLLIAAMGNDGQSGNTDGLGYPASHPNVAAIASYGKNLKVSKFSSSGRATTFAAPGQEMPGWCDGKREQYCPNIEGTSASSAIASGAAALVWAKHPTWTANQVLRVLIDTAGRKDGKKDTVSKYIGNGAIRPRMNLLEGKGKPGDPDISPLTGKKTGSSAPGPKSPGGKDSDKNGSTKDDAPDKVKVADSKSEDGDSSQLLPILGVGAGVLILAGCGFAVVRLRRN